MAKHGLAYQPYQQRASKLTFENYNACTIGSHPYNCSLNLGSNYQEIARNKIANVETVAYQWTEGTKVVILMFQNDRLIQRSQAGLT